MPLPDDPKRLAIANEAIEALDQLNGGVHPGYRPVHAKGLLITGTFRPTREAAALSRAPHFHAAATPVVARFSDFAGVPAVPDNADFASPRGFAVRFQLGEHVHTDIVAHSADGFPVRTAEEFVEFVHAVHASGPEVPHPSPIEQYLGGHPKALAFVQMPKPIPTSFARETYYSVSAYKFVGADGTARYVRYRILPDAGNEYLSAEEASAKGPNFLMEELVARLASGPITMNLWAQIANEGDVVDDATEHWPEDRRQELLGTIALTGLAPADDAEAGRIIFDPIPRVDGIESSGDPLLEPRADIYLISGRRRRAAGK